MGGRPTRSVERGGGRAWTDRATDRPTLQPRDHLRHHAEQLVRPGQRSDLPASAIPAQHLGLLLGGGSSQRRSALTSAICADARSDGRPEGRSIRTPARRTRS